MDETYRSPGAKPQQAAGGPPIDVRDEAGLIRELNSGTRPPLHHTAIPEAP